MAVTGNPGQTLQSVTNAGNTTTKDVFIGDQLTVGALSGTNRSIRIYHANDPAFVLENNATGESAIFENYAGKAKLFKSGTNNGIFFELATGKCSIGGSDAVTASAILTLPGTDAGFLPPKMTTTQKNAISSPAEGLVVYDITLHKLCVYNGSTWETVTSA